MNLQNVVADYNGDIVVDQKPDEYSGPCRTIYDGSSIHIPTELYTLRIDSYMLIDDTLRLIHYTGLDTR